MASDQRAWRGLVECRSPVGGRHCSDPIRKRRRPEIDATATASFWN